MTSASENDWKATFFGRKALKKNNNKTETVLRVERARQIFPETFSRFFMKRTRVKSEDIGKNCRFSDPKFCFRETTGILRTRSISYCFVPSGISFSVFLDFVQAFEEYYISTKIGYEQ